MKRNLPLLVLCVSIAVIAVVVFLGIALQHTAVSGRNLVERLQDGCVTFIHEEAEWRCLVMQCSGGYSIHPVTMSCHEQAQEGH